MPFTFTNRSRRFDEDVDETSLSHGTSFVSLIREETLSLIAGFLSCEIIQEESSSDKFDLSNLVVKELNKLQKVHLLQRN